MPFDYSRFLGVLEARARRLRGLSLASLGWAGTSAAVLAGMLAVRLLRIPLPYWSLSALVLPPLFAGAVAYAIGRSSQPRIPLLLLRVDDALGLKARLSSLYELRQRGGGSIFRQRIESEVRDAISGWRSALPIARRTIVQGSAGVCCVALAFGLAVVPLPSVSQSPLNLADTLSTLAQDLRPDSTDGSAAPATEATAPMTLRTDGESREQSDTTALEASDRNDATLDDIMRDLTGLSPNEAVLVPVSPDEIEELAKLQGEATRAVRQLLERIRDRLEDSPPTDSSELTPEELAALQREIDRGGLPPELEQGLNELMNRPESRSVEEIVEQLLDQFGDDAESESGSSEDEESAPPQSTAVARSPQNIDELLEELGQASSDEGQGSDVGVSAGPNESGEPSQDTDGEQSAGDRSSIVGANGMEDPSQVGGSEGPGGATDEEEQREPGFVREEEGAKIGSEGEFVNEFVTEGVPIELAPDSARGEPSFRVNYEQIASILRERGLPEGAIEIVRDYFNAITEGGS